MDDVSQLLDRPTAARLLGIRVSTLRRWWSSGRGPAGVKLSDARTGRVYYQRSELLRWAEDPRGYSRSARPPGLPRYEPPPRQGGSRGR